MNGRRLARAGDGEARRPGAVRCSLRVAAAGASAFSWHPTRATFDGGAALELAASERAVRLFVECTRGWISGC